MLFETITYSFRCFWKEFYGVGVLKFIADVTGFFGPLLLNKLVTFIETKSERVEDGYLYAAGLCAITLTGEPHSQPPDLVCSHSK